MALSVQNTTATGASIGTAVPVVGTVTGGIIGAIAGLISNLGGGKTQHFNFDELSSFTHPLADKLETIIRNRISDANVTIISNQLPNKVADEITASNWWKVGNDQWSQIPNDLRNGKWTGTDNRLNGTIWRTLVWGFGNVPRDNISTAYDAINSIFIQFLYPMLETYGSKELYITVDNEIRTICGKTAVSLPSQSTSISPVQSVASTVQSVASTIGSIFSSSPVSTSSGTSQSTTQASIFSGGNIVGVVVVILLIGLIFSKMD
jgi:hypothetical protein